MAVTLVGKSRNNRGSSRGGRNFEEILPQKKGPREPGPLERPGGETQLQPESLNEPIQVLQLNVPLVFRYSLVYQNVQPSDGSTLMLL